MPRAARWILAGLLFVFLIGGPIGYARYRKASFRNFHIVEAGKLYRSGQLNHDGMMRLIHDYGIRTVVSLREGKHPGDPAPDTDEQKYCSEEELDYYRLPYRSLTQVGSPWIKHDGQADIDPYVKRFLAIMDDPKHHPVLIHCTAGMHRTGAYVAIYRMEYDRWDNARALDEIKEYGYDDIGDHSDILSYLQNYVPRWKR
jgi:tyrosine-protein phosphatase SIW14